MSDDTIYRQAAIEAFYKYPNVHWTTLDILAEIKALPSARHEPLEITDEQAILHLQSTGWMQNHDREMYESGLREQLADDSGSYDSLIPCEDTISRQAAISTATTMCEWCDTGDIIDYRDMMVESLKVLPSAQSDIARDIATIIKNEKDMMAILKNARPERKWIPCSERLPAEGEQVLLTNFFRKMDIGWLVKTEDEGYLWEITGSWYNAFNDWIAWMPLPEPYKEEDNV